MSIRKSCVLSAAVAFAAAAGFSAHAANIAVPATSVLPVGGATATDRSLAIGWLDDVCDAAVTPATPGNAGFNIEVFTTTASFIPGTTRNYAIACRTAATAATGAAGVDTVLIKYSGGSGTGVTPVANNTTLLTSGSANWVDYGNCRDGSGNPLGGASAVNVAASGNIPAYRLYTNCPINAAGYVPKAGLSDVEPRLQVTGGASLPLISNQGASVPMGIAVSQNFFEALQIAQGLPASCSGLMASYTPECTPNLTSAQVRSLYKNGGTVAVNRFFDQAGVIMPNPPGGAAISVCRRGDSSGTQKSYETFVLGEGCGSQHTFVTATTTSCEASGCAYTIGNTDRVFAGTGSSDVTACLNDKVTLGRYAIGTLSLESTNFNDTNQRWRYVKLDGAFPSMENVVKSEYNFFVESACNRPSPSSSNVLSPVQAALAAGGTTAAGVAQGLCGSIRGDVVQVNPSGTASWLLGTLAVPANNNASAAPPITTAAVLANPTNSQTKAASYGGLVNNCNSPWTSGRTSIAQDDEG